MSMSIVFLHRRIKKSYIMLNIDVKIRGNFTQRDLFVAGESARSVTDAGSIGRQFGDAVRGSVRQAMWPALKVFNDIILDFVQAQTPVWTGRLLLRTSTDFLQSVQRPIRSNFVRWYLIADTYYARRVNATPNPKSGRPRNYLGLAVARATNRAVLRASQSFAQNLN